MQNAPFEVSCSRREKAIAELIKCLCIIIIIKNRTQGTKIQTYTYRMIKNKKKVKSNDNRAVNR